VLDHPDGEQRISERILPHVLDIDLGRLPHTVAPSFRCLLTACGAVVDYQIPESRLADAEDRNRGKEPIS
jgi:hypothetical protein